MGGIVTGALGAASKATPWGAIAMGASTLLNAGGLISGWSQAAKGRKGFESALDNMPKMGDEYIDPYRINLQNYQQAMAGNAPGYSQQLSQIEQAGARGRGETLRTAISSNAAGVGKLYQQELDAIRGLGIQQEQYKTAMLDRTTGARTALVGQQEKQFNINEWYPNQIALNQYGEMWKGGKEGANSALNSIMDNIGDFAGTRYIKEAYKNPMG